MRRHIAHGLAILLAVVSLGAAQGQSSLEPGNRGSTPLQANQSAKKKPARAYQVGTASWYGSYFHGKSTASGEPYNMYDLTAAHPSLPLGTWVRVTNLRNQRAVMVRINDRGPIVPGRIIDLSYGAARVLDIRTQGLQRVRLDLVQPQTLAMVRE